MPARRRRQESWRLALNLSLTAFACGVLFLVVGAWLAAWLTFAFGIGCVSFAGWLLRRRRD
jgi:hypothetical protein